jgi:hypothetical protein
MKKEKEKKNDEVEIVLSISASQPKPPLRDRVTASYQLTNNEYIYPTGQRIDFYFNHKQYVNDTLMHMLSEQRALVTEQIQAEEEDRMYLVRKKCGMEDELNTAKEKLRTATSSYDTAMIKEDIMAILKRYLYIS